jgi:tetratricopeptide (TPR) repeat protein
MSRAYRNRGELKKILGLGDDSKLDLIKSLILDPNQPSADFDKGALFLNLKMPEKAIPALRKALELTKVSYTDSNTESYN